MPGKDGYTIDLKEKVRDIPLTPDMYRNNDELMGEMRQEIKRLRAALTKIANPTDVVYGYANDLVSIAKEALS